MKKTILLLTSLFLVMFLKAQYNTNYGYKAGSAGIYNTSLGLLAGDTVTGSSNTFVGYQAGMRNTSGDANTFNGFRAGYSNTTGVQNTFVGHTSGNFNTTGVNNTFYGYQSGVYNTTGSQNCFIGINAGFNNTTGNYNTNLGFNSGFNNKIGSSNVFIGSYAGYNELGSNKLYIDNSNTATPLIYGDFSTDIVNINGKLGIGTKTPEALLDVYGSTLPNIRISSATEGYLQLGIATCSGCFANCASTGDAVLRKMGGTNSLHLVMPNDNNDGNSVISIGDEGVNARTLNVFNNGKVTIGTTNNTPDAKLEVAGNIKATKFIGEGASQWTTNGSNIYYTSGNILVGKTTQINDTYNLDVAGKVRANEIVVNTSGADFVFDANYKLRPLAEVENFIKANKHLPEVVSAAEMQANGISIGEMQTKLLQKVEELTLYLIEKDKEILLLKVEKDKQLAEQAKINKEQQQFFIELKKEQQLLKNRH